MDRYLRDKLISKDNFLRIYIYKCRRKPYKVWEELKMHNIGPDLTYKEEKVEISQSVELFDIANNTWKKLPQTKH